MDLLPAVGRRRLEFQHLAVEWRDLLEFPGPGRTPQ
jgi:hypothetical protein